MVERQGDCAMMLYQRFVIVDVLANGSEQKGIAWSGHLADVCWKTSSYGAASSASHRRAGIGCLRSALKSPLQGAHVKTANVYRLHESHLPDTQHDAYPVVM